MMVVGLLGGIGSGKSRVRDALVERCRAQMIDADAIGHQVLREPRVRRAIAERFGEQVLDAEGWIRRDELAKIVFEDSQSGREQLRWLESLTHPLITARMTEQLDLARAAGARCVILDAPVLLKAGWDRFCDHLLFVDAPWEQRRERVSARGWSEEELRRREGAQETLEYKRSLCDTVIDNGGAWEETLVRLDAWVATLPSLRGRL